MNIRLFNTDYYSGKYDQDLIPEELRRSLKLNSSILAPTEQHVSVSLIKRYNAPIGLWRKTTSGYGYKSYKYYL